MTLRRTLVLATATALTLACGDDGPTEPTLTRAEVSGMYGLTELSFDPQGSLPEVDLAERLLVQVPTLQLTESGVVQLAWRDPDTNLLVTVNGSYVTTASGVRIDFGQSGDYGRLLLSRTMTFEFEEGTEATLSYSSTTGGVSRQRLLELVPEFEGEQLLDPVPGLLQVTFTS